MSARRLEDHIIFDFDSDSIKAQSQPPLASPVPVENRMFAGAKRTQPPDRQTSPKIVTGPPKSLCLPRLHDLNDITSVLIAR